MNSSENEEYYEDDPEIVATVMIDGRPIKLKASPEFNAFADSVIELDPEPMFQQAVWLEQMSHFLEDGVRGDEQIIKVWGKTIVPTATHEAREFVEALYDLGEIPRRAAAILLRQFGKIYFQIASSNDPSLVPNEP